MTKRLKKASLSAVFLSALATFFLTSYQVNPSATSNLLASSLDSISAPAYASATANANVLDAKAKKGSTKANNEQKAKKDSKANENEKTAEQPVANQKADNQKADVAEDAANSTPLTAEEKSANQYQEEIEKITQEVEALKASSTAATAGETIDTLNKAIAFYNKALEAIQQRIDLRKTIANLPNEIEKITLETEAKQKEVSDYKASDYSELNADQLQVKLSDIQNQLATNTNNLNSVKNYYDPQLAATIDANRKKINEITTQLNNPEVDKTTIVLLKANASYLKEANALNDIKSNSSQSFIQLSEAQKKLYALSDSLLKKQLEELNDAKKEAQKREQEKLSSNNPMVKAEVAANQALIDSLNNYTSQVATLDSQLDKRKTQLTAANTVSQTIDSQISLLKGTLELNRLINEQKNFLPDIKENKDLSTHIVNWRVQSFQYLSSLQKIKDAHSYIDNLNAKLDEQSKLSENDAEKLIKIIKARADLLQQNMTELNKVISVATEIDSTEKQIVTIVESINNKLNQQDFFVRSTPSVDLRWLKNITYGLKTQIKGITSKLTFRFGNILYYIIGLLLIIVGIITKQQRRLIINQLRKLHDKVNVRGQDSLLVTPLAIFLSFFTDIDKPLKAGGLTLIFINTVFNDNAYIIDYFYYSFVFLMFFTFADNCFRRHGIINSHYSPEGSFYAKYANNDDRYEITEFKAPQPRIKAQPTKIFVSSHVANFCDESFITARREYLSRVELNGGLEPFDEDHTLFVPKSLAKKLEEQAKKAADAQKEVANKRQDNLQSALTHLADIEKQLSREFSKAEQQNSKKGMNLHQVKGIPSLSGVSASNTSVAGIGVSLQSEEDKALALEEKIKKDPRYLEAQFEVEEAQRAIFQAAFHNQQQPKVKINPQLKAKFFPEKKTKAKEKEVKVPYEVAHKWYSSTPKEKAAPVKEEQEPVFTNPAEGEDVNYFNLPNYPVKNHFTKIAQDSEDIRMMLKRTKWIIFMLVNVMYFNIHPGVTPSENIIGQILYLVTLLIVFAVAVRFARQTVVKRNKLSGEVDSKTKAYLGSLVLIPLVLFMMALNGYVNTVTILLQHGLLTFYSIIILMLMTRLVKREFALLSLNSTRRVVPQDKSKEKKPLLPVEVENIYQKELNVRKDLFNARKQAYFATFTGFAKLASVISGVLSFTLIYYVWSDLMSVLSYLDTVTIWQVEGSVAGTVESITLLNLLKSILTIVITYLIYKNIKPLLDIFIFSRINLSDGLPYAIQTVLTYLIIGVGFASAFGSIGLSWSKLQWLFAALSVGLGFGLQEIFANFVSGLIILFERPIRIGDFITIEGTNGEIKNIRIRATTLVDPDNKEVIIPNRTFVTGSFTNWSLSNAKTRLVFNIGIAYDTDVDLATRTLLEAAQMSPLVLKDPPASCYLLEIGASTYNFALRVYVGRMIDRMVTFHDIYRNIIHLCAERNIEMAFNQLDVFVKNGSGLEVKVDQQKQIPLTDAEEAGNQGQTSNSAYLKPNEVGVASSVTADGSIGNNIDLNLLTEEQLQQAAKLLAERKAKETPYEDQLANSDGKSPVTADGSRVRTLDAFDTV